MNNQQLLMVGIGSLLSGGIASAIVPANNSIIPIAASTAGALGGTAIVKKREREIHQKTLELYNYTAHSLAELNRSVMDNYAEFIVFKTKLETEHNSLKHEFASLKQGLQQLDKKSIAASRPTISPAIKPVSKSVSESPSDSVVTQIEAKHPELEAFTISTWLKQQDAEMKKYYQPQSEDGFINRISLLLGNQYGTIQLLYKKIKYDLRNGEKKIKFTFKKTATDREIEVCKLFCRLLRENDLVKHYSPHQRTIYLTVDLESDRLKFLDGLWLERFAYQEISNLLKNNRVEHQGLMNVEGSFSHKSQYELDALFAIDKRPLLIECKTYLSEGELVNFSRKINKLKIDPKDAFFIVADLSQLNNAVSYKPDFEIVDIATFRQAIAQRFSLVYPLVAASNCQE